MNKKIENNLDAILITIKDHIIDDVDMQCWEAVKELLEEFYDIEASKNDCINLFNMVMENKLTDEQLVAVSYFPYTKNEINALRKLENAANIILKNISKEDAIEVLELLDNGWDNALINILNEKIYPSNSEEMKDRIDKYNTRMENHLATLEMYSKLAGEKLKEMEKDH